MAEHQKRCAYFLSSSPGGGTGGEVCRLRLHFVISMVYEANKYTIGKSLEVKQMAVKTVFRPKVADQRRRLQHRSQVRWKRCGGAWSETWTFCVGNNAGGFAVFHRRLTVGNLPRNRETSFSSTSRNSTSFSPLTAFVRTSVCQSGLSNRTPESYRRYNVNIRSSVVVGLVR